MTTTQLAVSKINTQDFNAVFEALRAIKGELRDPHNNSYSTMTCHGVAEFRNGSRLHIVPLFKQYEYFCLNPIEQADDGVLQICTSSCGGVLYPKRHADLYAACQAYDAIGEITRVAVF